MVILLQLGQSFLTMYLPTINARVIDYGVANGDGEYILKQGILMMGIALIQFLFSTSAGIVGAKVALMSGRDLREQVYTRLMHFSEKMIGTMGAPTLITRATNDVQQVTQFVTFLFTAIIAAPMMFIGGLVLALSQSVRLSVVLLITIPLLIVVSVVFLKQILPYYRAQQTRIDEMNTVLRDQISGVRVVKAFTKEEGEKDRFERINGDLAGINTSIGKITGLMQPIFTLTMSFANIALIWIGGRMAGNGQVQIGQVIGFVTYISFILTATLMASMVFIMLPRAEVSVIRIEEILNSENEIHEAEDAKELKNVRGEVQFSHVTYSYAPDNDQVEPVLRDISFRAEPGKTTAIIGSTGCGKTTLLSMIPRLADVTQGKVEIDGRDVRSMKPGELDRYIGMVPQKAFLFSGTLAENLKVGKEDATEEELWEALSVAQAREFVEKNEKGLQMKVSEGGTNFSGGQRQRLAIARAIVRRPKIYLFDDSFSALDYRTDQQLRKALKEITGDATVIIVAQRISTIREADQILVMNQGRIEAAGTHEELMKNSRTYQEIVASQPVDKEAEA
ncbi:MAG: multidrug ABC transporter ATP-binding protein [Lachnospiraceae bacterium]|nr:MAG: multidrug ABC transporter ATP-binding protein [Lachnospiraceae bacterium]